MIVPPAIEEALYAAARGVVGDAPLAEAALARATIDRSRRYTSERDRLSTPTDRTGDLAARACFFSITDAMKVAIPLGELARRGALPATSPLRIVDVGAGCGAMSLGLAATLADRELAITLIDRDADALRIARAALGARATTKLGDVATTPLPAADLVIAGTVLNELPPDKQLAVVRRMLAALAPGGAAIIVEPALRETSRALHAIRDAIVTSGEAHVFAPCTRAGGGCPALLDPSDWCHEDRPLALPPRTRTIAQRTGLRDSGMRFSYLVLRREPLALVEEGGAAWRVVSAPHVEKGKRELFGCSDAGRVRLRLLKRHRGAGNRAFEAADRGDVLVVEPALGEGELDIGDRTVTRR